MGSIKLASLPSGFIIDDGQSFDQAFKRTLGFEGGYTVDNGGATNFGVTQTTYDNWRKKQGLPIKPVQAIDTQEAKQLYKTEYFDKPGFSNLTPNVAGVLFDYGVNAGPQTAAKALQKAVGASPDGVIGPKTLKSFYSFVDKNGEKAVIQKIIDDRQRLNNSLIKKDPKKYKPSQNGLQNRINSLKTEFRLSDLNPFSVSEAQASDIPQDTIPEGFALDSSPINTYSRQLPEGFILDPQLSANKNFDPSVPSPEKMEPTQADFDFFAQNLADKMASAASGQTVPQMIDSKKKLNGIIMRAPLLAAAPVAPIASAVVEGLNQAKNIIVSNAKKEKYSPLEIRVLNELIPQETPTAVKIIAMGGEALTDVALLGGLSNLAKQGLLKDTIKEIGKKLERAGYGTGQRTINLDDVKNAARGSTLDIEAERWLKAKLGDIKPRNKIGTTTPESPVSDVPETTVAPKPNQELTPQKPATPIERAAQHGEVVGIDAKSGLPVIDTSVKPQVQSKEYTGVERRDSDLIPPPKTKKGRFDDWLPVLDAYDTPEGKKYQIDKLDVSNTVKAKLLDHYGLLFDKPVVAAQTTTPELTPKQTVALAPATENIITQEGGDLRGQSIQEGQSGKKEDVLSQEGQEAIAQNAPVSPLHAEADNPQTWYQRYKENIKEYQQSEKGLLAKIYADQKMRSKKRPLSPVEYTKEELGNFIYKNDKYKSLYADWVASGYDTQLKPSIDRINPLKGYSLDNIQLGTWAENKAKGYSEMRITQGRPIVQLDDDGNIIKIHRSLIDAAEATNSDFRSISAVALGKKGRERVGGYKWRYANPEEIKSAIYNEAHGQKVGKGTAGKPTNNLKEYVDSLPSGTINITRDEIYSKFDNDLKPIAEIPQKYVKYLSASSNEVFSGKAYFIDHHINHHPTTTREDYLTIPEVLKSPDEVKQNLKEGKKGLVFIKKFDKYHAAVVSLDVENGKIILHKTFFTQTKKPYKKSPLVELEGEGGNSSISQAVKPPAESVSARPSDKNIPQNKNIVKPKGDPASLKPPTVSQIKTASSPQDLEKRIEQLNKFGQANAIFRRAAKLKGDTAGRFSREGNVVKIDEETITDPRNYMTVIGHELGHAIQYSVTGKIEQGTKGTSGFELFGDNIDKAKLRAELEAVTEDLVGKARMDSKPEYFYQSTELIARFFEKMIFSPGNLKDLAPTAVDAIELQSLKHPIIQEFLLAASGGIDKGTPKFALLRDMRETYQKHLGKFVGNRAYDQEMVYRAMKERGKIVLEKFINDKMKMVKDSPESLFRAAESIKISRGGKPEFGTRDYAIAKTPEEEQALILNDYVKTPMPVIEDGQSYPQYAKQRYTPEEAKAIFDSLSDNGKKLIVDFTAERKDAKDFFNREVIKETYKIKSQLEGWVHHYFDDRPGSTVAGGQKFKQRVAGSRKQRTGTEGYVEDFKKAMTKALVDLEGEKVFNEFIPKMLAMVTKPLGQGQTPAPGWIEVVGNIKTGIGLPIEKRATIIDSVTGERVPMKQSRYQMPKEIYERYKLWRGLIDEATTAVRIVNDLNRYWRINILTHPGTSATNFISGGIQFSSKILTDFYREVLTGKIAMPDTQANISAMLKVLLPKGWMDAPDWVYGSDLSNFYGEFMKKKSPISESIDSYGNKALVLFGAVERYWKKVIMTADGVADIKSLSEMTKEGLRIPTKEEEEMIAALNEAVDLYAYDYDNVPVWLEQHQKSIVGQAIKPFAKYPYKYAKQILNMVGEAFDQSIPIKDRMAKILALATIAGAYAAYSADRRKKQKTPVSDKSLDIPPRLQTRGRVFITTDEKGRELFVRVAKYPFFNLTEAGMQFVDGNWSTGVDVLSDMLGSIGPAAAVGLMAFNYRSKYNQYEKPEVILGDNLATFLPGYRILNDVSRALDPFQRKQETFGQTFTQIIPTTDQALQEKLHGKIRTERVPIEGDIGLEPVGSRTTVDVPLENVKEDILLSLFTGVYRTRLDPKVVEAYIIRKQKNLDKKNAKE